ncbi:beta-phosphoglucomutase (beta-PGM) [Planococcus antarcticus DSM 14505]|uniref:Beta-phosphoglucomutase n=1 Tax=Planococcus antarcticus DSM 14505 TaxID=1185653 RepID=A0A1C7DKL3_9BACL|nr:beta-phosphoglucomutase [Planococcus antarcticus]ANU11811.1 beta-phosphoglucomutase [Planococcus antarcticus DSM 14505]EIM06331.1 beta-phosphoglucomutase (beta-PGM) [Planococcus antarcticus DSM 14505]
MVNYPKAFIYDLDGVITDTAEFHFLAWQKLAEEINISVDRQFNEQLKGINRMDSLDRILERGFSGRIFSNTEKVALATRKNEYYLKLIESIDPSHILPGIETLLQKNKERHIKIALGSASNNASAILDKLELTSYFDYIVDASKVKKGKPDPETFTTAASALGIAPDDCVGIEDAAAGIESINKAGMFSVGIGNAQHLAAADYLVEDTAKLLFEDLIACYSKR